MSIIAEVIAQHIKDNAHLNVQNILITEALVKKVKYNFYYLQKCLI